jgi:hypothetical protein
VEATLPISPAFFAHPSLSLFPLQKTTDQYFVNGFAPVISVLSKPSRNRLLKNLLPATSNSPILLHALVGWAASHLAVSPHVGGEPYTSIARITTSIADQKALVNINSMGMPNFGHGHGQEEELSLENEMWLLLILGGIEVSRAVPPLILCT